VLHVQRRKRNSIMVVITCRSHPFVCRNGAEQNNAQPKPPPL
jgi:hypothetical protein